MYRHKVSDIESACVYKNVAAFVVMVDVEMLSGRCGGNPAVPELWCGVLRSLTYVLVCARLRDSTPTKTENKIIHSLLPFSTGDFFAPAPTFGRTEIINENKWHIDTNLY